MQPTPMKSPRTEYLEDKPRVLKLRELLADPDVIHALRTAYSQYAWELPTTANPQASWNNACRLEGAKGFLEKLEALTVPPAEIPERPVHNKPLTHEATTSYPPTKLPPKS